MRVLSQIFGRDEQGPARRIKSPGENRGISGHADRLSYKPHLSLLRYDGLAPESIFPVLSRLASEIPPLPVYLEGVAFFAGGSVLWLAPAPNVALLSLHSKRHARLHPHVAHCQYQPSRWVPQVTLAEGLDHAGAAKGMATLLPVFTPIEGRLDTIEIVRFPPVTVIWSQKTITGLAGGMVS